MTADTGIGTPPGALAGTSAGVPYVALPPASGPGAAAPVVVALHAFEPPRGEHALAGTLPMAGLYAWRVYLGLPLFGDRLPAGGVAEVNERGRDDYLLHLFGPVVEQAAAELADTVRTLRSELPGAEGPVALTGVGAGGTAALLALAESDLEVAAVGVVGPVVAPQEVIAARTRNRGARYRWNDRAHALARRLDLTLRASDVFRGRPGLPLLVVRGGRDEVVPPEHAIGLCSALAQHDGPRPDAEGAPRLRHITVPELGHTIGTEPGLLPGPPTPGGVLADRALTEWFAGELPGAAL